MPARAPSATPVATTITVTGCTSGTGAKRTRPAAAAPASVAITVTSFADCAPASSQEAAPASSASAASSSARADACVVKATPAAARRPATNSLLSKNGLPLECERDLAVGDRAREDAVVGDDERRARRRLRAQQRGELGLALGVDAP